MSATLKAGLDVGEPTPRPARVSAWIALPWFLTLVRIGLIPVLVNGWVLCQAAARAGESTAAPRRWVMLLLVAIGVSDVLDGAFARWLDVRTRAGARLDAVADKLAQLAILSTMVFAPGPAFPSVPLWFLALFAGRDLLEAAGFAALRLRRGPVEGEHRWHGKASTVLAFALFAAVIAGAPGSLVSLLVGLSAALVVFSTGLYVRDGLLLWGEARSARNG
ncbi:MAG: CDP-alcohol phosphatidyltransferase family protein [Planctomycetota bacterium]|jgi:phosphatidylglycerophosphate synthase|nr:CDP-alcohol phosphatidyltransferase family protein [Planctomycetota bacterium]MDP6763272.1 CDP-alcohol phosphatidyltransferase family protein [Planctomycetota bacterium]MDP6988569.1 CDP-alcohol phosphatidyltransferase family protein [Planctomycetota bacterium]